MSKTNRIVKNMKSSYERDSRETFRLVVREKFPAKTFDTVSAALTNKSNEINISSTRERSNGYVN